MELMKNVQAWTAGLEIEYEALSQLRNIAGLPILAGPVAVMPDVHFGKGATVGSVIPTIGAIIPAAIGYRRGHWLRDGCVANSAAGVRFTGQSGAPALVHRGVDPGRLFGA